MNIFRIEIHLKQQQKSEPESTFCASFVHILIKHETMELRWAQTHEQMKQQKSDELLMNYLYHQRGPSKNSGPFV